MRFVVPTSTSRAPDCSITSGTRNEPPISTLSPRLTATGRPLATVASTSSTTGRVVVHHDRRLDLAQSGEQTAYGRLARAAFAGGEIELDRGRRFLLRVRVCRPTQVRVEQHTRGVDDRRHQLTAALEHELGRARRVANSDRLPGGVDQQRLGKSGQGPGECVDRRRTRVHRARGYRTCSAADLLRRRLDSGAR